MDIVRIVGIVFAAAVILIIAYLYRESAIVEGKAEWGIGPVKFKLGGKAQKQPDAPEEKPVELTASEAEQTDTNSGHIESGTETKGDEERTH